MKVSETPGRVLDHFRQGGTVAGLWERYRSARAVPAEGLVWAVDEVVHFRGRVWVRGWVHATRSEVRGIWLRFPRGRRIAARYGLPSPDVAAVHGPAAAACRFEFEAAAPHGRYADELTLVVATRDGRSEMSRLYLSAVEVDPYHRLEATFWSHIGGMPSGSVLELGSRDRSGNVRTERIPAGVEYVGMDIAPGPNVDVVGDAHDLERRFGRQRFDAVFAVSVFEHLLMPWKVAVEINRVLRPGGWAMIGTHQSFPVHDAPWDYWRYSDDAWSALFNDATGFRIREVAMGEPAAVVPLVSHGITRSTPREPAFLTSGVIVEKIGETTLSWDVAPSDVVDTAYRH